MPTPIAICLEDLDAGPRAPGRFLRCTALAGRQPGLRVGAAGEILWRAGGPGACELWVSGDERLILYRPPGAPRVRVRRDGRAIDAPEGKPVVLLDEDEVETAGRRLRVRVHGALPAGVEPAPPSPVPERAGGAAGRVAAAAVALGAAALGCAGGSGDGAGGRAPDAAGRPDAAIEVRTAPPAVPPPPPDAAPPDAAPPDAARPPADAARATRSGPKPPIEIRNRPPDIIE